MAVLIRERDLQYIRIHAKSTYPDECCGFLLGVNSVNRTIHRVISASNVNRDSPRNRYDVDPKELMAADEEAQRSNLKLIGIYHSHPDAPAEPSQYDLEHAWPYYTYLVLSIQNGDPKAATAWKLGEDQTRFHQEELRIEG